MSKSGHLWAVGFDDTEAGRSRSVMSSPDSAREKHELILLDVAVAVPIETDH